MEKLIDIESYPIQDTLNLLLQDKTTKGNIIWATDTYEDLGTGFSDKDEIGVTLLMNQPDVIKPRIAKDADTQLARTRKKAEVYTPVWLCCQCAITWMMNGLGGSTFLISSMITITGTLRMTRLPFQKRKPGNSMWTPEAGNHLR